MWCDVFYLKFDAGPSALGLCADQKPFFYLSTACIDQDRSPKLEYGYLYGGIKKDHTHKNPSPGLGR